MRKKFQVQSMGLVEVVIRLEMILFCRRQTIVGPEGFDRQKGGTV